MVKMSRHLLNGDSIVVNVHEVLGVEVVVSILLDDRYLEAIDGEMHIFTLKSTTTPGITVLKFVEAEDGL